MPESANLLYLTGFDPRFEEALLLLGPRGRRLLLVGNDGEVHAATVRHPALWSRIERNREFMQNRLGLTLRPETLPLSLANDYLPPGWFSPSNVCTFVDDGDRV